MLKDMFIRRVLFLVTLVALFWFLWAIRSVLLYMIIAAVVMLIASPAVSYIDKIRIGRFHIPRTINVVVVLAFMVVVLAGLMSLLVPLVASQAENLQLFDASRAKENLIVIYHNVLDIAASYGVIDDAAAFSPDFIKNIDFSFLPNLINNIVSSVGSVMIMIFAVLFFAFFFLKERNRVTSFILSIVPDGSEGKMSQMMTKTSHLLSRYVIGLLIQMSIIFTFTLILLITFGVDNAFLTATVVALLNVVPYIGPFMGGTMIVIFTMLGGIGQPDMIHTTLYVLGGFLLIQLFDNFVSQPVIFSSSVKAHPLEIFTVTLIGGTLMGIIGMIVAVPLYTLVRIIAKEFFWEFKIVRVFTKDI